jgi:nucleotide-binding universal stress UspA family protein
MTLQKILWPTDFSEQARPALDYIKSLTRRYEAEIHILYVMEDVRRSPNRIGGLASGHPDNMLIWQKMKAHKRLDQICIEYLEDCPCFVRHIAIGDPAREILKLVEKEKIDMVVMSTQGTRAPSPFRFGSVAARVIKDAPVPVVTIPPAREAAPAA